jgi:hypothetical protein
MEGTGAQAFITAEEPIPKRIGMLGSLFPIIPAFQHSIIPFFP